jgi:hypothetical protein
VKNKGQQKAQPIETVAKSVIVSTTLGPPVPLKIVTGTDGDDSEIEDWELSFPVWETLVLPAGWIYAADHPNFTRS